MSFFEIIMLLCFGIAWPFSIHKSLTSHSTKGKSLSFLLILLMGYLSGIAHKLVYDYDEVLVFYVVNLCMVGVDTLLYVRNRSRERHAQQGPH